MFPDLKIYNMLYKIYFHAIFEYCNTIKKENTIKMYLLYVNMA